MGKPTYEKESNLRRAILLLKEFSTPKSRMEDIPRVKYQDDLKLVKIRKYIEQHNAITTKQYKTLLHYCRVYKIRINNAIDFILD